MFLMIITGEKCCIPARLPSLRNRREEKEERAVAIWLCWLAFLALQTGMRRAKPSQAVELLKCFHKRSSASRFCYFFLHPLAHSFVRLLARSLLRPDSSTSEKTKSANIWTAPFKISIAAKKEREFHDFNLKESRVAVGSTSCFCCEETDRQLKTCK